jgi:hypothetical protein
VYLAELLTDCRQRVRRAAFPRVLVETTLVKLALVGRLEPLERLLARLDEAADAPVAGPRVPDVPTVPSAKQADKAAQNAPVSADRELSPREKSALDAVKRQFGVT